MGGIMCHIIYQYQKSHFCIQQSGVPGNKIFSPNASLEPHSAKGARGFHWRIWCAWVALITIEFAKYCLTGLGTISSWAALLCLGSRFCILWVQLADKRWLFACHHSLQREQAGSLPYKSLKIKGYNYVILNCIPQIPWDHGQMSSEDWAGWDWDALLHLGRPQSIGAALLS